SSEVNSLDGYLATLAELRGVSKEVITCFRKSIGDTTKLYAMPGDPIGKIIALNTNLQGREKILAQAFLCCLLARNYFAHHYYPTLTLAGDITVESGTAGFVNLIWPTLIL